MRTPASTAALLLLIGTACATTETTDADIDVRSCPIPGGEFGPIGCAIVQGVAWQDGQRLAMTPIRGEGCNGVSFVGPYASSTARTDQTGAFTLTIGWIEPLSSTRRTPPDTATVELRTFSQASPSACAAASARAHLIAHFAANGSVVRLTGADSLVFLPIE